MRRTTVATPGLVLVALIAACCIASPGGSDPVPGGELCIYNARCLTNSPRLIKVQHSPQSQSYSYFYKIPRRIRKVVRKKIIPPEESANVASSVSGSDLSQEEQRLAAEHAELFDHVQLTPVFGRRLNVSTSDTDQLRRAEKRDGADISRLGLLHTNQLEPQDNDIQQFETAEDSQLESRPTTITGTSGDGEVRMSEAVGVTPPDEDGFSSRFSSRFDRVRSSDLWSRAGRLRAASQPGTRTSPERTFRVQRLKRRRKIMAKKLAENKRLQNKKASRKEKRPRFKPKVTTTTESVPVVKSVTSVYEESVLNNLISEEYPTLQPAPGIKGFPGVDYPIYQHIPQSSFDCAEQRYWGMFADTETQCQVWHYCDQDGNKHSFLCPNGTVFSQVTFICDWWYNVDCNNAVQLYVTNEALSLLPAPPEKTFPEDFQGPIVDWYIYQRHQERAYRKEKFLKQLEAGTRQKAVKFLETHDFPPWFTERDQTLYLKLKALERQTKASTLLQRQHRPVKKALTQYAPW